MSRKKLAVTLYLDAAQKIKVDALCKAKGLPAAVVYREAVAAYVRSLETEETFSGLRAEDLALRVVGGGAITDTEQRQLARDYQQVSAHLLEKRKRLALAERRLRLAAGLLQDLKRQIEAHLAGKGSHA